MAETKAAIAELFYRGTLQTADGEYIPCDFSIGCFTLPFLLMGNVLPLFGLLIAFGQYIIRKPESILNFYRQLQSLDLRSNLVIGGLILFAVSLSLWLFTTALPELKLIFRGFREAQYQKKHQQYRYGLLLTQEHLAIRCFSNLYDPKTIRLAQKIIKSFAEEPLIFSRRQIIDILLCSERLESKQRIQYLVITFFDTEGYIQRLRLPSANLDIRVRELFDKLKDWHK